MRNFLLKNNRRNLNILLAIFLLICYSSIFILYMLTHDTYDVKAMKHYYDYINSNVYEIGSVPEEIALDQLVNANKFAMTEAIDKTKLLYEINTVDDLAEFIDNFKFADDASNWTRCYIYYCAYNWAEFCINDEAEDYWHVKYETNKQVGVYNYGTLIKYKIQGTLITNATRLSFLLFLSQGFVIVYWFVYTLMSIYRGVKE